MVTLTDVQTAIIADVARPLQPQERAAFMAALFEELLGRRYGYSIGDGELHRTLRELQHRFFEPPRETEDSRLDCYSRRHGAGPRAFERRA